MSEPIVATGKKVEDAIKSGLEQLGLTLDEVKVEIISEGGFLKKAQVRLTPDVPVKVEVKETTVKIHTEDKPEAKKVVKKEKVETKTEVKTTTTTNVKTETKVEMKKAPKVEVKVEPSADVDVKVKAEETTVKKEKPANNGPKEFIEGLIKFVGANAAIEEVQTDKDINIKITGEKMGQFIGNNGETLNAIQYLANVVAGKNRAANKRVYVDAGNYKSNKDDRLREIADRMSKEVLETGESRKLKPMSPYERRIIHSYLQNVDGISTVSKGEEPNRCLIIIPKY